MVSLQDIADDLGVSVSLVSKVLNGRLGTTGIRKELERDIRRRAAELNYRKNNSALALLRRQQDVVGVFIHREGRLGSGLMEELMEGISRETMANGWRQLLAFFQNAAEFTELCRLAHRGIMDGLLVGGIPHREIVPTLRAIQASGLPVVSMMPRPLHRRIANVAVDQVEIGRLGTRHLIACGCRRIAHIRDFADRYTGYRRALAEAHLPFSPRLVFGSSTDFGYEKGRTAARHFLRQEIDLDGLFAQSDEEALGALNVFCDAGWRIPEDLRIVGVDNAPYAEFSRTPLTSVSQSGRERGQQAARVLLAAIRGEPPQSLSVEPRLVVRASTAGPDAKASARKGASAKQGA